MLPSKNSCAFPALLFPTLSCCLQRTRAFPVLMFLTLSLRFVLSCRCLLSVFCLFWFVLAYYPLQHMQRSYWGCHKSLRKIFLRTGIRVSASVFWQKTSDLYNRIIMVPEQLLNCFLRWLVLNVKCEPPAPPPPLSGRKDCHKYLQEYKIWS